MADARKIEIVISAADEASPVIQRFQGTLSTLEGSSGSVFGSMADDVKGLDTGLSVFSKGALVASASIAGAIAVIKEGWNLARASADFEEQKAGLDSLASFYGTTAEEIMQDITDAAGGTVSQLEAVNMANQAFILGLKPDQIKETVNQAERLGDVMGKDVTEAYNAYANAVTTGNTKGLSALRMSVDLEGAVKSYAASIEKTVAELSEEEVRQARVNALLEEGSEIVGRLGPDVETSADKFDRYEKSLANFGEKLGVVVLPAMTKLIGAMNMALGPASDLVDYLGELTGSASDEQQILDLVTEINGLTASLKTLKETAPASSFDFFNRIKQLNDDEEVFDLEMKVENLTYKLVELVKKQQAFAKAKEEYKKNIKTSSEKVRDFALDFKELGEQIDTANKYYKEWAKGLSLPEDFTDRSLAITDVSVNLGGARITLDDTGISDFKESIKISLSEFASGSFDLSVPISLLGTKSFGPMTEEEMKAMDEAYQYQVDLENNLLDAKRKTTFEQIALDELAADSATARANILSAAYDGMQEQMLSLVETGKFSVGTLAKVVADQVKIELTGISAKATIWAIYETAMGFKDAAVGNAAGAALHFESAATFGTIAAATLAAAAGVQALVGGIATEAAQGTEANPTVTTSTSALAASTTSDSSTPTQEITINVYNPLDGKIGTDVAQSIIDAINDSGENLNYKISVNAVG